MEETSNPQKPIESMDSNPISAPLQNQKNNWTEFKITSELLKNRFFLAGISSLLLVITIFFADFFILFALAPAILMAYLETPKKAFLPSLLVGLSPFLFLLWIINIKPLYYLGVIIYGLILFIFLISTSIISKKINSPIKGIIIALLFSSLIWLHVFILGYAWFNLAIFLNIPLLPHYIGIYGIYFIMILFNASIAEYFLAKDKKNLVLIAIILGVLLAFSITPYFEQKTEGKTKIALIQEKINSSPLQKTNFWLDEFEEKKKLTVLASKENPSIIVWPEYSIETNVNEQEIFFKKIKSLAKETNSYLIVGMKISFNNSPSSLAHDSAVIAYPDGEEIEVYNAMNPFPIKPYQNNIVKGDNIITIQTEYGKFNVIVCFDEVSYYNWKLVSENKPDFIIDVASNQMLMWHGRNILSKIVSLNVKKNQIPLFRATSTGITAAYDSNGQIIDSIKDGKSGFLIVTAP